MLIDSGCIENIVSRSVVQALQIKITEHLQPCKISWVKRGIDILVSEMCRFNFSIGKHFVPKHIPLYIPLIGKGKE